MRYVTVSMLKRLGACEKQIKDFKDTFGTRALINKENYLKAINNRLHILWLFRLHKEFRKEFLKQKIDPEKAKFVIENATANALSLVEKIQSNKFIPQEKKNMAKRGLIREGKAGNVISSRCLYSAFVWSLTKEGSKFWMGINGSLI